MYLYCSGDLQYGKGLFKMFKANNQSKCKLVSMVSGTGGGFGGDAIDV